LQQLKVDLQIVFLADPAGFELKFADFHGLLKALQVLLREIDRRFRQLDIDEQRGHLIRQGALVVRDQRARLGCHIFRGLIAARALPAPLDQVGKAEISFGIVMQIIGIGRTGIQAGILLFRFI